MKEKSISCKVHGRIRQLMHTAQLTAMLIAEGRQLDSSSTHTRQPLSSRNTGSAMAELVDASEDWGCVPLAATAHLLHLLDRLNRLGQGGLVEAHLAHPGGHAILDAHHLQQHRG